MIVTTTVSPNLASPPTVPVTGTLFEVDSATLTTPSPATVASILIAEAGAPVSTMNGSGADGALVLPAGSVALVVTECGPSLKAVTGVNVHVPSG